MPKVSSFAESALHAALLPQKTPTYKAIAKFSPNGYLISFEDQNLWPDDVKPYSPGSEDEDEDDKDESSERGFLKEIYYERKRHKRYLKGLRKACEKLEEAIRNMQAAGLRRMNAVEITKKARSLAPDSKYIYIRSRKEDDYYNIGVWAGKDDSGKLLLSRSGAWNHLEALILVGLDLAKKCRGEIGEGRADWEHSDGQDSGNRSRD